MSEAEASRDLGSAIRAKRAALRLSQRDVARAAATTAAAISHIERGSRKPSAELLARIAAALGASMDELLRGPTGAQDHADQLYLRRVSATMRMLPPSAQKEVADFAEYIKYRTARQRGE